MYGTPAYQSLTQFKAQGQIAQVISLFDITKSNERDVIDEARRLSKQMELRDAITLVFTP